MGGSTVTASTVVEYFSKVCGYISCNSRVGYSGGLRMLHHDNGYGDKDDNLKTQGLRGKREQITRQKGDCSTVRLLGC
jgi:hypothetical protein